MHHFKLYYKLRRATWPRNFIMGALEVTCWQAQQFQDWNLHYLYCIDLSCVFELTVPSLFLLKMNCVFALVSFPGSLLERQMVVISRSYNHLRKMEDMNSPCVIEVISSLNFDVTIPSLPSQNSLTKRRPKRRLYNSNWTMNCFTVFLQHQTKVQTLKLTLSNLCLGEIHAWKLHS